MQLLVQAREISEPFVLGGADFIVAWLAACLSFWKGGADFSILLGFLSSGRRGGADFIGAWLAACLSFHAAYTGTCHPASWAGGLCIPACCSPVSLLVLLMLLHPPALCQAHRLGGPTPRYTVGVFSMRSQCTAHCCLGHVRYSAHSSRE